MEGIRWKFVTNVDHSAKYNRYAPVVGRLSAALAQAGAICVIIAERIL